jgi:hypothetical protein
VYFTCPACGAGRHPADAALGLDGRLTTQATRLICLAGGQRSFAHAEVLLRELCGWRVSDERIRQACHAEADRIATWRAALPPPAPTAPRPTEFQVDATKVNTDTGWRDMKIGVFAWRGKGPAASPDRWDERQVPRPTARFAFAAIEEVGTFGPRWGEWATRLGVSGFDGLSVIADGAAWIWNAAADQFPGHRGVLDFFHAVEHLGATATALFGEGTGDGRAWFDAARGALLADGWWGIQEHLGRTLCRPVSDAGRAAIDQLVAYLASHSHRLNYRHRLACGEAIGSGLIEGACKQVIGRRMKQTGARWTVPNANRMAGLCCLTYSAQWDDYWNAA